MLIIIYRETNGFIVVSHKDTPLVSFVEKPDAAFNIQREFDRLGIYKSTTVTLASAFLLDTVNDILKAVGVPEIHCGVCLPLATIDFIIPEPIFQILMLMRY